LQGQSISFAQQGPLLLIVGAQLTNAASGGGGTGAITYQSSNASVLTVNATSGLATGMSAGSATVTATKSADASFSQAVATYTVNVRATTPMGAWMGTTDSQVFVPDFIPEQYLSVPAATCATPEDISSCPRGQAPGALGVNLFSDFNATLTTPAYLALGAGTVAESATLLAAKRFSERIGHAALFFKNRYWVIGGGQPQLPTGAPAATHTTLADIWSSPDGRTWKLETDSAPFGPRWFHQAVVYNGAMWVISGARTEANVPQNFLADVWSSTDGVSWTQRATNITLPWYSTHLNVVVFNGAMWAVSGGATFSSTDGVTWTPRSASGAIAGNVGRGYASLNVYNGSLWYIAGVPGFPVAPGAAVNDVWKSSNGVDWVQVTASAPFAKRFRHQTFVMNGKLWVFGGQLSTGSNGSEWALDAWSTTDGLTWTAEPSGGLDASYLAKVIEPTPTGPDRLTLIGGIQRGYSNNVWQTTNGLDWTASSAHAQFSPRSARGVSFNGEVWIIGGSTTASRESNAAHSNEIWRSDTTTGTGTNWTRVATQGTIFSPRDGHSATVFQNKLWVIGGWDGGVGAGGTETRLNDVWSSADGITWTKHEPTGGIIFSPRVGHDAVVFQNKLWVIGGNLQTETDSNEVWSSTDGDTWTLVPSVSPFTARRSHRVVAFNGELWMTGGGEQVLVGADPGTSDVWHSADGASWALQSAPFPPRLRHAAEVFNGRMYVIGGASSENYLSGTLYNDVWSSADGIAWVRETPAAQFAPRWNPALIVHGSGLWLAGGFGLSYMNDVWRSSDGKNWRLGFAHDLVKP
jgi:hypothetical protein